MSELPGWVQAAIVLTFLLVMPFAFAVTIKFARWFGPRLEKGYNLFERPVVWYLRWVNAALRWAGDLDETEKPTENEVRE